MPLAVPEPADPRRQPLVGDALTGHPDPPGERLVPRELFQYGPVGGGDVGRIAGQRGPAERALALAEQGSDVRGDEPRVVERTLETPEPGLRAEVVAVVEDLRSAVEERDHPGDVRGHRRARSARVSLGVTLAIGASIAASAGTTSAALPRRPIDSASRRSRASVARRRASSTSSTMTSRYRDLM